MAKSGDEGSIRRPARSLVSALVVDDASAGSTPSGELRRVTDLFDPKAAQGGIPAAAVTCSTCDPRTKPGAVRRACAGGIGLRQCAALRRRPSRIGVRGRIARQRAGRPARTPSAREAARSRGRPRPWRPGSSPAASPRTEMFFETFFGLRRTATTSNPGLHEPTRALCAVILREYRRDDGGLRPRLAHQPSRQTSAVVGRSPLRGFSGGRLGYRGWYPKYGSPSAEVDGGGSDPGELRTS